MKLNGFAVKGFVLSFDAMLALFVAFFLLFTSMSILSKPQDNALDEFYLQEFSFDVLTVLENSGKLQKAIALENNSELKSFLNSLPAFYCAELQVSKLESEKPIVQARKQGCSDSSLETFKAFKSIAVVESSGIEFFTVELKAWRNA